MTTISGYSAEEWAKELERRTFITLMPHQREGIAWMHKREKEGVEGVHGGIMYDEMGLGKTLTSISVCAMNPVKQTLIVVPCSLLTQWKEQMLDIFPFRSVCVYHGQRRTLQPQTLVDSPLPLYTITTYHTLIGSPSLLRIDWDRVMFDEAHIMRTKQSQLHTKVQSLLKRSITWCLTGTPCCNKMDDIRSLLRIVSPTLLKVKKDDILTEFHKHSMGRTRDIVPALVHKPVNFLRETEFVVRVEDENDAFHERCRDALAYLTDYLAKMEEKGGKPCMLTEILLKRMISTGVYMGSRAKQVSPYFELRMRELDARLARFDRSIVFTHYRKEQDFIAARLKKCGYHVLCLHGSHSASTRKKIIEEASSCDSCVLIMQIQCGGVGLNLQMYQHVALFAADWCPANELQAIARANRMSVEHIVEVSRIYVEDPYYMNIDERMREVLEEKKELYRYIRETKHSESV